MVSFCASPTTPDAFSRRQFQAWLQHRLGRPPLPESLLPGIGPRLPQSAHSNYKTLAQRERNFTKQGFWWVNILSLKWSCPRLEGWRLKTYINSFFSGNILPVHSLVNVKYNINSILCASYHIPSMQCCCMYSRQICTIVIHGFSMDWKDSAWAKACPVNVKHTT